MGIRGEQKSPPELSEAKQETIKVAMFAFIANVLGKGVSMPVGIAIAAILGPGDFGLLAIVNLIVQYLSYLNLGFLSNITREVPIAYGRGDTDEVDDIYSTVFTNFTLTTLLGIGVLWVLYLFGFDYDGELLFKHILLITIIKTTSYVDAYFHTYVKGEGKFIIFGQYELVTKIFIPMMNLVFVYFFQLTGMLISLAMSHVLGAAFAWYRLGRPFIRFKINIPMTITLMRTGILMYLNKIIDGVFISIGLIMAGQFLTKVDVGLLSFAMVIASSSKVPFADIFTMTVRRQMGLEGGKHGIQNYKIFSRFFGTNLVIYTLLMSTVIGFFVIFYTIAVDIFLEKFHATIPIFMILYFAINFYSIRTFLYAYLNVTRQMNKRSLILLVGTFINLLLCYLGIQMGYGIIGITVAVSLAFMVVSLNAIWVTFSQVFDKAAIKLFFILKMFLISGVLTGLIYLYSDFRFILYVPDYHLVGEMVLAAIDLILKLLSFGVLSCILFIGLFPREKVFAELLSIFRHLWERTTSRLRPSSSAPPSPSKKGQMP